jgi:hypothetical protein
MVEGIPQGQSALNNQICEAVKIKCYFYTRQYKKVFLLLSLPFSA